MKIGIFTLFCVGLLWVAQKAASAPLTYFVFFPLGLLVIFYFFDSKDRIFLTLSAVLLLGSIFYRGLIFQVEGEVGGLAGAAFLSFGFLLYCRQRWEVSQKKEESLCDEARLELKDLKQKHTTRLDSLLHLEKQVGSLINLFEIARDFNECLDLKETAQILFKKVLPELFFERAELVVVDPQATPTEINRFYVVTDEGIEEKNWIAPDAKEREWVEKVLESKSLISTEELWLFPLSVEGELNGLFAVQGAQREDLAKFEVLSSQLALHVRKIRLYEVVKELSIVDGLTGVFVRRHFLERFEEEIRRALKHSFPLSVLMLDIDHFKRYNDEFGHLVGDATLREVAQVIRASVRNVDIVSRYGGEEFVIVVPETREEGALEVAERIRSSIARKAFRVYDEETRVTVSVGISTFPQDVDEPSAGTYDPSFLFELLQKADRALYRAKEEGRNRVVPFRSIH